MSDVAPRPEYLQLYPLLLQTVQDAAGPLMGRMVIVAKREFQNRLDMGRDIHTRNVVNDAFLLLQRNESRLQADFPVQLRQAFEQNKANLSARKQSFSEMSFEQLELMDEEQVQESVVNARVQQNAMVLLDAALAELNTLVSPLQGYATVRQDANPLRPDTFLLALRNTINATQAPLSSRLEWLNTMGLALAKELQVLYAEWLDWLKAKGVQPAGFKVAHAPSNVERAIARQSSLQVPVPQSVPQPIYQYAPYAAASPARTTAPSAPAAPVAAGVNAVANESLLNLERLRSLLAGDWGDASAPAPTTRVQAFAQNFARQFESSSNARLDFPVVTEFQSTVPAALEALQQMQKTDAMVERLTQRSKHVVPELPFEETQRSLALEVESIRKTATGMPQRLSLEVVQMMVDSIAQDHRLLPRVQRVIRQLEPALMRLAISEPRIFTDRHHPARQLVNEMSQRSLAFGAETDSGYADFCAGIEAAVDVLRSDGVFSAQSFERILSGLVAQWQANERERAQEKEKAMRALQHAEQRNLLAQSIAQEVQRLPDIGLVPTVVTRFLRGPWAQVVAQARLIHGQRSEPANKYQALMSALLWSAHPELPYKNVNKLTKLVPVLLATLREGLDSVGYPAEKTSEFFEALMGLHQQVFANLKRGSLAASPAAVLSGDKIADTHQSDEPWLAPTEVKQSNFVEISDVESVELSNDDGSDVDDMEAARAISSGIALMPLGTWIEVFANGRWERTQLSWASPHGTLFLFTSAQGKTQSMTRRTHDKLVNSGHLVVVADHSLVDGALDAVAQQAMRNSLEPKR